MPPAERKTVREEIAEIRTEQKWHRWLLLATLASSALGQAGRFSAPAPAYIEWIASHL